uniref:U-box domain-containing protein 30-like n=1 Tax=Erigeron canadensis TaxID=72917 RepID=UPI001CB9006A|nr:U-box domain-containing protein 30-like [Erigeron canadensis]
MPMYQPSVGGQILDLETAVKDGILGGGGDICVTTTTTNVEKMDLKKMIEQLDTLEVPSVFICPISLEPMRDPVTLCTGQTYERSNILKWFALGHFTCPTTMQELWDDSVTPNSTLNHLIYTWFSQKYLSLKKRSEDVQGRCLELFETLKKVKGQTRIQTLKEIRKIVASHESVKRSLVNNGGVSFISSLLGPFTSHVVGSETIGILVNLELSLDAITNLSHPTKISLMVDVLNEGSLETKINCVKLMEVLFSGSQIVPSLSLLVGVLRLVKDKRYPHGILAGLRLLKVFSSQESLAKSIISIGGVPQLVEMLPHFNSECLELALYVLEFLSCNPDGALALKNCPNTIPSLVKLLMRVSECCTQYALSILWEVCNLSPEESAATTINSGLATKLLLVIQSGCNAGLKQRAAELLKLCSLNYTDTIFISKCKLSRTLQ